MSVNAIIEKILEDAHEAANKTLSKANDAYRKAIERAQTDADVLRERSRADSAILREVIMSRFVTTAKIDAKKALLRSKQNLIARAFSDAIEMVRCDNKRYAKFIEHVVAQAEDGDKIILSKEDAYLTEAKIKAMTSKKIKVSSERGNFSGGVILSGKETDRNFTLDAILADLKKELEITLAGILFNGEKV